MALARQAWVLAVAILLVPEGFAVESEFSHKLHLNVVGATCVSCHASALTSRTSQDSIVPQVETCQACHNGQTAPEVDTTWMAVSESEKRMFRFDHEFHLQLGNVTAIIRSAIENGDYLGESSSIRRLLNRDSTCEGCHRGLEEVDLATKMNLPVMSDCLVCHKEIDNPFSCEECHLPGSRLKPIDHTREFSDLHSTGKLSLDKATCLPCHGTNFACMGCH